MALSSLVGFLMLKKLSQYAGAMLLAVLVVVVIVVLVVISIPSPSPEERAAFERWQADQVGGGDAQGMKGSE